MPTALKNLKIKHVSLVDRPANQGADVVLAKRDAEPSLSDLTLTCAQADAIEKTAKKRKTGGTGMAMGMQDSKDPDNDGDDDEDEGVGKRDFSAEDRKRMAGNGQAEADGSYPVETKGDLENAITAIGRSKNQDATKRHIIARAKALGAISMLPEDWKVSTTTQENTMTDVTKALPERATDANPDPDGDGDDDRTAAGDTDNSHFNSDGSRKPTMKADTETVTKADLETIRKQYEDTVTELKKSVDDITARAVQAESVAKAEADARQTREAIAKAEREYPALPGTTPTDTGTLLREIGKSVAAETVAKLETLLKSASVAIAKGELFTESGATGNANTTDSPVAKLETIAKGLRESDPKLSQPQAIAKAVELNPELASEYRKQFAPAGGYKQYS